MDKLLCKRFPRHFFPYDIFNIATRNEIMVPLRFFRSNQGDMEQSYSLDSSIA
jgi:hypothetical protein